MCSIVVSALIASGSFPKCNIPDIVPKLYGAGFYCSEMLPFKLEHFNEVLYTTKLTLGPV